MDSLLSYFLKDYSKKLPIFYTPPDEKVKLKHYRLLRNFKIDDNGEDYFWERFLITNIYLIVTAVGFGKFGKGVLKRMDWTGLHPTRFYCIAKTNRPRGGICAYDGKSHKWDDYEMFRFSKNPDILLMITSPGNSCNNVDDIVKNFGKEVLDSLVPIIFYSPGKGDYDIRCVKEVAKRMIVIDSGILRNYLTLGGDYTETVQSLMALVTMTLVSGLIERTNLWIDFSDFKRRLGEHKVGLVGFGEVDSSDDNSAYKAFTKAINSYPPGEREKFSSFMTFIISDRKFTNRSLLPIKRWFLESMEDSVPFGLIQSGVSTDKTSVLVLGIFDYSDLENKNYVGLSRA